MTDQGANYSIRDEIREFWSARAATFDQSVGHEIFSEAERAGWHRLIRKHLGMGNGRAALDLACGTGVISHLMADLRFSVTGLDWSEAMLNQARAKAKTRGADIRFVMRDAERTLEPHGSFDVITTRHLVWTLVDPKTAFAEWFALLKPGGKLLIVDGNMGKETWVTAMRGAFAELTGRPVPARYSHMDFALAERHRRIQSRLYFAGGMEAGAVCDLLVEAGFAPPLVDRRLGDIHWAQARKMPFWRGLERLFNDRYAIAATKPGG